ncbi:MAG: type II toxin-antitoxin system prevent-host-death family antitoxin [Betaproteobacteria bacterium]|nr:type II toxin-antitoxin system prevent-host-death family antitoxin [Betaproteobacteria bacterium]
MDRVGVFEAKARLSELVERAQTGRSTIITKKGKPVARIVPERAEKWDRSKVLDEAEAFRKRLKIKGRVDLRELIEEGRR